jgi:hypothetical protein
MYTVLLPTGVKSTDVNNIILVIHVSIHGDRNAIQKEAKKILKYKVLTIEIQRM